MFKLDIEDVLYQEVLFDGINYQVIDQLPHNLLLVVPQKELEEGKFPLQPTVIPDIKLIEARRKIR